MTEEDQEVTGNAIKRTKTYVKLPEVEPTCSKYIDRHVDGSGQHGNNDEKS